MVVQNIAGYYCKITEQQLMDISSLRVMFVEVRTLWSGVHGASCGGSKTLSAVLA